MDGKKVAALCVLGFLGTAFIGYCIYFDRKRRSHPEYKKRVLKSMFIKFVTWLVILYHIRKKIYYETEFSGEFIMVVVIL